MGSEKYIGNINSRKLHIVEFADGRCKIDQIKDNNKACFDTYEKAMSLNDSGKPNFIECGICFPKYRKNNKKQKGSEK